MAENYALPDALVSTSWVAEHGRDKNVRLVEVDVNFALYEQGHLDGAVGWNWQEDLCDQVKRDIIDKPAFERLCGAAGIGNGDAVVLYGDANNWFAAWAFWQFKLYGHKDVRLMNGGRTRWEKDERPYTTVAPMPIPAAYQAKAPDASIRAFRADVEAMLLTKSGNLVDVRSPDEFTGKVIAPPGLNETAQRGGHIPGAANIPWAMAANEDGTFKSPADLRGLYGGRGVTPDKDTIAYCRIGERSAHTWFVLKYLLGYSNVKNYDGSWTEWGNLVGAPIEK